MPAAVADGLPPLQPAFVSSCLGRRCLAHVLPFCAEARAHSPRETLVGGSFPAPLGGVRIPTPSLTRYAQNNMLLTAKSASVSLARRSAEMEMFPALLSLGKLGVVAPARRCRPRRARSPATRRWRCSATSRSCETSGTGEARNGEESKVSRRALLPHPSPEPLVATPARVAKAQSRRSLKCRSNSCSVNRRSSTFCAAVGGAQRRNSAECGPDVGQQ